MKITKRPFGTICRRYRRILLDDGKCAWPARGAFDHGATIRSVQVPDRAGRLIDAVLGYDDLPAMPATPVSMVRQSARFGNRIGGAEFALNGKNVLAGEKQR